LYRVFGPMELSAVERYTTVVIVLGHPHYYPRFGFVPAKPLGIVWGHDAPEETFMVKEIQESALARTRGVVEYRPEFAMV